jgi:hypothetical protein
MKVRQLSLLALVVPFVTVTAQKQQGSAPPSAAAIVAKAKAAKLDQAHGKSAAINGKKFNIVPADFSGITSRDQVANGLFLGVLDNEAGASEDVSLPPGRFNLYLAQTGNGWEAYAEQNGRLFKAKRAIERADSPPNNEPTFSRGSGCWWVWLYLFSVQVCW